MYRCFILGLFILMLLPLTAANNFVIQTYPGPDGRLIDKIVVPGIPVEHRVPGAVAVPTRSTIILGGVPAFDWSYGCSATSAAMMAGYYDRLNYGHIYTGPTNDGTMPLDNSSWGVGECPLSATHQGFDGLATEGHADRFWTNNSGDDPFGPGDPTGTYYGCTADYMGTNQQWWGNIDGSTTFANYVDGSPLHDPQDGTEGPPYFRDGVHGMRLFFESRGYQVVDNYNQYIYGWEGNTLGYTLDQFKASIDSGIPVMIQIQGHSMVGIGYETTSSTIYILNTWDYSIHPMTWGGEYSGMLHYGVSVVQLAAPPEIYLDSNALWASLPPDAEGLDSFVIHNLGTGELNYSLELGEIRALSGATADRNISGSTLVIDAADYSPGSTSDWTFTAYNASNDDEWLKYIYITFPPGITINSASSFVGGGGGDMYPDITSGEDITIGWNNSTEGWGVIYGGQYASAIVNVTIDPVFEGNISLPFQLVGDIYGSEPHIVSGLLDIPRRPALLPWCDVLPMAGTIASGTSQTISGHFLSAGLAPGSYQATLEIHSNDAWNPIYDVSILLEVTGGAVPEVSAIYTSGGNAVLEWQNVPGAVNYKIYRAPEPDGTFVFLGSTNLTVYEDTQPLPKAFYIVTMEY